MTKRGVEQAVRACAGLFLSRADMGARLAGMESEGCPIVLPGRIVVRGHGARLEGSIAAGGAFHTSGFSARARRRCSAAFSAMPLAW